MGTSTMFDVIVKVTYRGHRVRTTRRRPAGQVQQGGAGTAHTEFVICDESIEQDHRGVKRVTRPMLGFKSFDAAQWTLAGVELMHMPKKGQMVVEEGEAGLTPPAQFYALAA